MSRNIGSASLQKTYDNGYLKCSTAVYYESQGNEDEALRCWQNALEELTGCSENNIALPINHQSATERALIESLRELEVQCKERIDLLQALRISRQDTGAISTPPGKPERTGHLSGHTLVTTGRGWIGQGTVPAITYPELSRPDVPKSSSSPNRGPYPEENATSASNSAVNRMNMGLELLPGPSRSAHAVPLRQDASPRPQALDKRPMRTTLRANRTAGSTGKVSGKQTRSEGPGASQAATMAWTALASKDRLSRETGSSTDSSSTPNPPRASLDAGTRTPETVPLYWDTHTRRLVSSQDSQSVGVGTATSTRHLSEHSLARPSTSSVNAASSALKPSFNEALPKFTVPKPLHKPRTQQRKPAYDARSGGHSEGSLSDTDGVNEYMQDFSKKKPRRSKVHVEKSKVHKEVSTLGAAEAAMDLGGEQGRISKDSEDTSVSLDAGAQHAFASSTLKHTKGDRMQTLSTPARQDSFQDESSHERSVKQSSWSKRKRAILKALPPGVDDTAAKQILNEIVVHGDEVHWDDVAGLTVAKNALRETVVYPFLRPDLFMGLREPARGMLLFGPPGTGKTMLARAVATESKSTFFSISASSLTSKYLGESEKLVRALFALAKQLAPSIIFVDEIDSLLSQRSVAGEHEASRRIKTEFLIQWSDLQRAAAGRATDDKATDHGDPTRVLVLAATNLPWAIDEAARRRFVRRQYIPLPEAATRSSQFKNLLGHQKHSLTGKDIDKLVGLTEGFSGSDITALAKDAAMGPLRSLGEALLHMTMDQIRPINMSDFEASLNMIRPSVSKSGLQEYEDWAKEFGERGG